ncbi:MAG: uracil-DNA glycosylase [Bacilli bacterium]
MFHNNWDDVLKDEMNKCYFNNIRDFVVNQRKTKEIYPSSTDLFKAFFITDFNDIKVVILGQDPYHGENQAMGLSFSVRSEVKTPPSLQNIFKELKSDLNIDRKNPDLTSWAKQGVFLLNTVLTVEKDRANSHKDIGWEKFTDFVIKQIDEKRNNVVFILWGSQARSKKKLITNKTHYIIESVHPSPLSAYNGFFGSKPFSKANGFLKKNKIKPIVF